MSDKTHLIAHYWRQGEGENFTSVNPATNEIIWRGKAASASQVEMAVLAARKAWHEWAQHPIEKRIKIIEKFGQLLTEHKNELANTISQETGKPLWESNTEVAAMIGKVAISINAYHERTGEKETDMLGAKAVIRHKPHGILAVFGPYNFPGHLPNGHIIPALLAGNCVIFKPSELTPKVAEEIIKLWLLADIPHGVINLLQGKSETGKSLTKQAQIDGILFTGSSNTGKLIHQQYANHPEKILALEMGGNNPLIVKGVKNTKAAIHDIIQSAFITAGQRCTCARRLFIENNSQGDKLLKRLVATTSAITIGFYNDKAQPFIGSMISHQAAEAMITAEQELISLGAKPLLKMHKSSANTGFITPGIIDVTDANNIPDEEHFGPLLKVYRFDSFSQAIKEANNTKFGLSAGLLADDACDYQTFYQQIRAGIVNWNKPLTGASSAAPFGGIGVSGNYRASAYYAADYCAYPVASIEAEEVKLPDNLSPGLHL